MISFKQIVDRSRAETLIKSVKKKDKNENENKQGRYVSQPYIYLHVFYMWIAQMEFRKVDS